MDIAIVTESQMQRLLRIQEAHELAELRATTRILSINAADERFAQCQLEVAVALAHTEDAYITFAEDDLDDWETAKSKSDKLDRIERHHDRAINVWENARRRIGWEARQVA